MHILQRNKLKKHINLSNINISVDKSRCKFKNASAFVTLKYISNNNETDIIVKAWYNVYMRGAVKWKI